jgi:hypothetical protein
MDPIDKHKQVGLDKMKNIIKVLLVTNHESSSSFSILKLRSTSHKNEEYHRKNELKCKMIRNKCDLLLVERALDMKIL